ncbi:MAG TPA: hypothetical protein PLM98_17450 [Thiolinea sp.]|nr:hypothetical protein [Thiolinea sp.]
MGQLSYLHSDDDKACTEASLLSLPNAVVVGELLVGTPEHAGCSGKRVIAYKLNP